MNATSIKAAVFFLLALFFLAGEAQAQWSLSGTFENRQADPSSGFGVQIERSFGLPIPVLDLKTRGHFSFFNEEVDEFRDFDTSMELQSYDYGGGLFAEAGMGLFAPYAGIGLGLENIRPQDQESFEELDDENSVYYYFAGGVGLSLIPSIRPFAEYRFSTYDGFGELSDELDEQQARFLAGIQIRF